MESDNVINEKTLSLVKDIKRMERRLTKLVTQINDKKIELQQICPHNNPIENLSYIDGGYLEREEFITTLNCEICGKELDRKVKYGGFC